MLAHPINAPGIFPPQDPLNGIQMVHACLAHGIDHDPVIIGDKHPFECW